ncbi:PAS-domain containing protein [Thermomonas sp.]|uniref:hybrid sensor histidine kinase/response regulator n=1 Tax=Thermomonas sp. TaxID=1971895 RepID=UPI0039E3AEEF
MSAPIVLAACVLWTAMLFGIASWGERSRHDFSRVWPVVFALSLGVHCTAWTYYGLAAQGLQGFIIPPTLLGMALVSLLCVPFLRRLAELVREHHSATIADLVVARLGTNRLLGAAITLVALVGIVPYIALQLRAVAQGLGPLLETVHVAPGGSGMSAFVAAAMTAFTWLFGARHASATEHNRGIVLALAFESLVKLAALLAVGIYAMVALHRTGTDIGAQVTALVASVQTPDYLAMVGLGALAAFTLPHQFHVGIVELRDTTHLKTARWLFPLYLLLIGLLVLPLALAGSQLLGASVQPDLYVVTLPLAGGNPALALIAYVGGLSAATGMMILSALTLSIMIGNHWFGDRVVRGASSASTDASPDLRPRVLAFRRIGIVGVFAMAWLYSGAMAGVEALSDFGLISFTALAQLAPAMWFAVYRPHVTPTAILSGLAAGTVAWLLLVMTPMSLSDAGWPFTDALPVPAGWRIAVGMGGSLAMNLLAVLATSGLASARSRAASSGVEADVLRQVAASFLSPQRIRALLGEPGRNAVLLEQAEVTRVERELTAVIGAGMARLLIESARRGTSPPIESMRTAVGEAAQALRFNQQLLEAALENMSQGISVVDAELRLVAWNRRYEDMFGFPRDLLQVGRPIADLTRWALQRMPAQHDLATALSRRIEFMRQGTQHLSERVFPDGATIEIRGNPMPGGGYVATFTDVTAFRTAESELRRSNETLERRVDERTALMAHALHEAERANAAKTRFLTAVGHDLVQPLHAAQLLTDAMSQHVSSGFLQDYLDQIRGALGSTDGLLSDLLDISKLEAGGMVAMPRAFALSDVLEPLAREFSVLAAAKGLRLRAVPTSLWVTSDPQLLRRILQNFLANAVRYTQHGGVLLGVRRRGARVRIDVYDTGPGIPSGQATAIFEEFRRGEGTTGPGLGLGLAIAERLSELLETRPSLKSRVGHGSVFSVEIPLAPAPERTAPTVRPMVSGAIAGTRILLVDNDADALAAVERVLASWGCEVQALRDGHDQKIDAAAANADLWLFDYHLDAGDTGVQLWSRLSARHRQRPTIIVSADASAQTQHAVREAGLSLLAKPFKPLALRWAINHLLATPHPRTDN